MSYLSLTDADREAMLATIGVASVDELFRDIPARDSLRPRARRAARARRGGAAAAPRGARGEERRRRGLLPRRGDLRPPRPCRRRRRAAARRAPDRLHAVPARDEPGRAAGDLRVPDGDLRADGDGRLERVRLRRHDRRRRRLLRRQARDGPHQDRPHRGDQPAGAAGREDVRARLRPRGGRGAPRRRRHRPGPRSGGGAGRGGRDLPAAELLRVPGARAGARCRGGRGGCDADRARRPRVARRARGAGELRLRAGDRRGPVGRQRDELRRPALRVPRRALRIHPPPAGPDRRRDGGRRGRARLCADPADPRAAHQAREGDLEHHHQPDPAGARRAGAPEPARPAGAARAGGDLHGPRRLCEGAAARCRARAGVSESDNIQGVCRAHRTARLGGECGRAPARDPAGLRARPRLPGARRRAAGCRHRAAHGGRDRPAGRGAARHEADLREVAGRAAPGHRRAEARPAGARGAGGARPQAAAAPARARRARGAPPLHRALDAQLRDRHRLLSRSAAAR